MFTIEETAAGKFIEVRMTGKLTKEAYDAFVPMTEEQIEQHGKVRMVVVMHDFHGWDAGAVWEDTKFGMRHFRDIERLAIVGETKWEKWMTAFCRPFTRAKIRYFDTTELDSARDWIIQERIPLHHHLLQSERILILSPEGPLAEPDFLEVAEQIDPVIDAGGPLNGLMIDAPTFPGWEDFASMMAHFRFIKQHHKSIRRVAVVTDDRVASHLPAIGTHLVAADVRHFPHDQKAAALDWLLTGETANQ